jgi:hypothetical protein
VRLISTELASPNQSQRRLRAALPVGSSEEWGGSLDREWLGEVSFESIVLFSVSVSGDGGKMLWHSLNHLTLRHPLARDINAFNPRHFLMNA